MDNPIPMPTTEKTITGFALLTYAWVLALSMWGGIVNYIQKVRLGQVARFNITELIGDVFVSGFTGLLTFWMCQAAGFGELLTAVFVGVSGHMGARMIGKLEQALSRKFALANDETVVVVTKKEGTPGVF